jgi:hypothetical protein
MSYRASLLCLTVLLLVCGYGKQLQAAEGAWKERTEVVWSKETRALIRKTFRVWDPHPERDLIFLWEPRGAVSADPGDVLAEGSGTLSWHPKDAADYDRQATYSVFKGSLRGGRPHGEGSLVVLHTGWSYTGQWLDGLMHGRGVLRLENGDRYEGDLVEGRMQGLGKLSAADGSVYIGGFRDDLRDGTGTLLLAEGSYRTLWLAGREIARERLPGSVPLQSPLVRLAAASTSVKLGLSLDIENDPFSYQAEPDADPVHGYAADYAPGLIDIHLGVPQILRAWKGDGELFAVPVSSFSSVFLKAEIENAGTGAAQVAGASLIVAESRSDPEPYVEIGLMEDRACGEISSTFTSDVQLANRGWGQVRSAKLTYAFGTADRHGDEEAVALGTFDASTRISIASRLQKLRVDTERLKKARNEAMRGTGSGSTEKPRYGFVCPPSGDAEESEDERAKRLSACFDEVKRAGVLGDLAPFSYASEGAVYTRMAGRIEYQWIDGDGKAQTRTSRFSLAIPLISFHVEMGEGGCEGEFGVPEGRAVTRLMLDRRNYQVPLPKAWLTKIEPGRKAPLQLVLAAPKSSQHKFQLVLQLADGTQVASPVVALSYFRPRPIKAR